MRSSHDDAIFVSELGFERIVFAKRAAPHGRPEVVALQSQQEWKRHGQGPWNYSTNAATLRAFWEEGIQRNKNYESIVTIGMRGDGDMPMAPADDMPANMALLEKVVADQRAILAKDVNPKLPEVPQLWALYKEVQEYYDKGMRVPDDVTLLWCDDNWGNIRRLPAGEERKRTGGAGVYRSEEH